MEALYAPLGWVMRVCYDLLHNYGLALILFTLLTKVILFPVSLWVHANGIKMVRMEPAVNRLKIRYFGDEDRIAEETSRLYKQEHYSPFASVVPIAVQLLLLLGLIQIIYHPLTYVLALPKDVTLEVLRMRRKDPEIPLNPPLFWVPVRQYRRKRLGANDSRWVSADDASARGAGGADIEPLSEPAQSAAGFPG